MEVREDPDIKYMERIGSGDTKIHWEMGSPTLEVLLYLAHEVS